MKAMDRDFILDSTNRHFDPRVVQLFLDACQTKQHSDYIVTMFHKEARKGPGRMTSISLLLKSVDETRYGLSDWISALFEFENWLKLKARNSDLEMMIGYLNCCCESSDAVSSEATLVSVLHHMLDNYGFNGR